MNGLFLKILNMSISASWLVLAVLLLRLILKKAPKWVNICLWGIVALRLIFPFSIESAFSLIPSAETVSPEIMADHYPQISTGITELNDVVNPIITESFAPNPGDSANPLQILIPIASIIWLTGIAVLLLYTAISYWRLRQKVETAVILRDNIFQSENVGSPFVLGIIKPRIYLPYEMKLEDMAHVIAHERSHIRRRDHWWKPLGFLLLTIHWFNPIMWLAYILLCRDIELACDEKVIRELGSEARADYTQALLACSINRRSIAACPLAFGEVGVKQRVRSIMNYKKPAFWIVLAAVIICIVVAVCFLTNPKGDNTFAMKGQNLTDIEPQQVIDEMSDILDLGKNASALHINANNFAMQVTADFDYADAQAIRVFYSEGQQTYSAQLRIFCEENEYFVTEPDLWPEQQYSYVFQHYLEALKCLPQTQIREMSPDADQYIINLVMEGTPDSYDRSISYSPYGVGGIDGWYIHLEIQPLHEQTDGGYHGTAEEVIHVFYGGNLMEENDGYVHEGVTYRYRLELTGKFPNSDVETTFVVLTNREDLTFDMVSKSMYSSNLEDTRIAEDYVLLTQPHDWGISLSAENVTPTGLTVVCNQSGGSFSSDLHPGIGSLELLTGSYFWIEKLDDGVWTSVPEPENLAWTTEAYVIQLGGTTRWETGWSSIYGELEPGQYRIGKTITLSQAPGDSTSQTYYAEFTIE